MSQTSRTPIKCQSLHTSSMKKAKDVLHVLNIKETQKSASRSISLQIFPTTSNYIRISLFENISTDQCANRIWYTSQTSLCCIFGGTPCLWSPKPGQQVYILSKKPWHVQALNFDNSPTIDQYLWHHCNSFIPRKHLMLPVWDQSHFLNGGQSESTHWYWFVLCHWIWTPTVLRALWSIQSNHTCPPQKHNINPPELHNGIPVSEQISTLIDRKRSIHSSRDSTVNCRAHHTGQDTTYEQSYIKHGPNIPSI